MVFGVADKKRVMTYGFSGSWDAAILGVCVQSDLGHSPFRRSATTRPNGFTINTFTAASSVSPTHHLTQIPRTNSTALVQGKYISLWFGVLEK